MLLNKILPSDNILILQSTLGDSIEDSNKDSNNSIGSTYITRIPSTIKVLFEALYDKDIHLDSRLCLSVKRLESYYKDYTKIYTSLEQGIRATSSCLDKNSISSIFAQYHEQIKDSFDKIQYLLQNISQDDIVKYEKEIREGVKSFSWINMATLQENIFSTYPYLAGAENQYSYNDTIPCQIKTDQYNELLKDSEYALAGLHEIYRLYGVWSTLENIISIETDYLVDSLYKKILVNHNNTSKNNNKLHEILVHLQKYTNLYLKYLTMSNKIDEYSIKIKGYGYKIDNHFYSYCEAIKKGKPINTQETIDTVTSLLGSDENILPVISLYEYTKSHLEYMLYYKGNIEKIEYIISSYSSSITSKLDTLIDQDNLIRLLKNIAIIKDIESDLWMMLQSPCNYNYLE